MAFYAYEKIKNELARQREQRGRLQRRRIISAAVDWKKPNGIGTKIVAIEFFVGLGAIL